MGVHGSDALIGALVGACAGIAAGASVSLVQLELKRWRNRYLIARGRAGRKDAVRIPLEKAGAVTGLLAGSAAQMLTHQWSAAALGGAAPAILFLGVAIASTIAQAVGGVREGDP